MLSYKIILQYYLPCQIGDTALLLASEYGDEKAVQLLLKSGAQVNTQANVS